MTQEKCIYWWHIVNNGESSLIQKCHKTQQNNPVKKIGYLYHMYITLCSTLKKHQ